MAFAVIRKMLTTRRGLYAFISYLDALSFYWFICSFMIVLLSLFNLLLVYIVFASLVMQGIKRAQDCPQLAEQNRRMLEGYLDKFIFSDL